MAGPVLSSTIRILDRASAPLRNITNQGNKFNQMMQTSQTIAQRGTATAARGAAQTAAYARSLENMVVNTRRANDETRKMHITMTGMLTVMAYFAINLQIIRGLMSPFTFMRGAIETATKFQDGLGQINALLRLNQKELKGFQLELRSIAATFGITLDDALSATKEISSSISSLNRGNLNEAESVLEVLRAASKLAVIDNATMLDSVSAIRTVLASMNIEVTQAQRVANALFATVDVGTLSFKDLAREVGNFLGTLAAGTGAFGPEKRMRLLEETLGVYAHLTNFLGASEASTAVNRLQQALVKQGKAQRAAIAELEAYSGIDLSFARYTEIGPQKYFGELSKAIAAHNPELKELLSNFTDVNAIPQEKLEDVLGESTLKIINAIFDNIRAARPAAQLISAIDQVGKIQEDFYDSMLKTSEAFDEAYNVLSRQKQRWGTILDSFKVSLTLGTVSELGSFLKGLNDALSNVIHSPDFDDMSTGKKITAFLNTTVDQLNFWWEHGGEAKIDAFASDFIEGLATFMYTAVQNTDKFVAIGESITEGIFKGLFKVVSSDPGSLFKNPLVQGFALSRFTGMGFLPATVVAGIVEQAISNGASGDTGSMITTLAMLGAMGGIGRWRHVRRRGQGGGGGYDDDDMPVGGGGGGGMGAAAMNAPFLFPWGWGGRGGSAATRYHGTGSFARRGYRPATGGRVWESRSLRARRMMAGMGGGLSRMGGAIRGIPMMYRAGLPLLLTHAALSGVGPFGNAGGIPGLISSQPVDGNVQAERLAALTRGSTIGEAMVQTPTGPTQGVDFFTLPISLAGNGAFTGALLGGPGGAMIGGTGGLALGGGSSFYQWYMGNRRPTDRTYTSRRNAGVAMSTIGGATAGALAGAGIGLLGGPFAPITSTAGAIGGGIIGGVLGFGGAMLGQNQQRQRQAAADQAISMNLQSFKSALGVTHAPAGMIEGILAAGQEAGLSNRDMQELLYTSLAIAESESGMRNVVSNDPTRSDPNAKAYGPFQLNTGGGLGTGLTHEQLMDPRYTSQVAAKQLIPYIRKHDMDKDPNFFARAAAERGWPGMQGLPYFQRMDALGEDTASYDYLMRVQGHGRRFMERGTDPELYSQVGAAVQGANIGTMQAVVEGDVIIQANGQVRTSTTDTDRRTNSDAQTAFAHGG